MKLRQLLIAPALALCWIAANWPAGWVDCWLAQASTGHLRLAGAEGSLWHGQAVLAAPSRNDDLVGWLPLTWDVALKAGAPAGVELAVDAGISGKIALRLHLGGWRVSAQDFSLPLPLLVDVLSGSSDGAGWHGRFELAGGPMDCDWKRECHGGLEGRLQHLGVDWLPGTTAGSYRLHLEGQGNTLQFAVRSDEGMLRVDGHGERAGNGNFHLTGSLDGPPELIGQLPQLAPSYLRTGPRPGQITIAIDHRQ